MSFLKVLGLSILGFLLPVSLALYITSVIIDSEDFWGDGDSTTIAVQGVKQSPKVIQVGTGAAYASIASDPTLDPETGRFFIISFLVKFDQLPQPNSRHNVIAKYEADKIPYPGWAFSINRFDTSVRPEVYVKSGYGKGGWFTFDDIEIKTSSWYAFTIVMLPTQFVNLFVQEIGDADFQKETLPASAARLATISRVRFAGGYELSEIRATQTAAKLVLGANRQGRNTFRGEVALILIAKPETFPLEQNSARQLIDGGPSYFVKRLLAADISLWISSNGKDESQYQRSIEFTGGAGWQTLS